MAVDDKIVQITWKERKALVYGRQVSLYKPYLVCIWRWGWIWVCSYIDDDVDQQKISSTDPPQT